MYNLFKTIIKLMTFIELKNKNKYYLHHTEMLPAHSDKIYSRHASYL